MTRITRKHLDALCTTINELFGSECYVQAGSAAAYGPRRYQLLYPASRKPIGFEPATAFFTASELAAYLQGVIAGARITANKLGARIYK